jgi:hypothetical protein
VGTAPNIVVPGSGAVREPAFADSVQQAVVAWMLWQLPGHGSEGCPVVSWTNTGCECPSDALCPAGASAADDVLAAAGECIEWLTVITCMPRIPAIRAIIAASRPPRHRKPVAACLSGAGTGVLNPTSLPPGSINPGRVQFHPAE